MWLGFITIFLLLVTCIVIRSTIKDISKTQTKIYEYHILFATFTWLTWLWKLIRPKIRLFYFTKEMQVNVHFPRFFFSSNHVPHWSWNFKVEYEITSFFMILCDICLIKITGVTCIARKSINYRKSLSQYRVSNLILLNNLKHHKTNKQLLWQAVLVSRTIK